MTALRSCSVPQSVIHTGWESELEPSDPCAETVDPSSENGGLPIRWTGESPNSNLDVNPGRTYGDAMTSSGRRAILASLPNMLF